MRKSILKTVYSTIIMLNSIKLLVFFHENHAM